MENSPDLVHAVLAERHADRTPDELAAHTGLDTAEVRAALQMLLDSGKAVAVSNTGYVSDAAWKRLVDTATKTLSMFHKRHPYKAALPYGELRAALQKAATVKSGDALFTALETHGFLTRVRTGATLPGFALVLPPKWQTAADEMLPVYVAGGLTDPPWHGNFRAHYPRDVPVDAVLDALCERGELAKLSDDLYVATESVNTAVQTLRGLVDAGVPLTIGAVRDATGSSRRVVVPLLEYLDKAGVTTRTGETRTFAAP